MIIKLNVFQDGACAQIYAFANDNEESFEGSRSIKIWHNQYTSSMTSGTYQTTFNFDNDFFVAFNSPVPFKEFCMKFKNSEYNEHSNYIFFRHNCANAANFALGLAGIESGITDTYRLTRVGSPDNIIRIPSHSLSPSDLFHLAKEYKIKTLETPASPFNNIHFKISLSNNKLTLWKKSIEGHSDLEKQMIKNVEIIIDEIKQYMKTRTHHAELYLKVLINTIDILMYSANLKDYEYSSSFLRERFVRTKQLSDDCFKLSVATFMITSISFLCLGKYNWKIDLLAGMPTAVAAFKVFRALHQEAHHPTSAIINDTKLSQAMTDLADNVKRLHLSL